MAWFRCTGGSGGSLKLRTASGAIASFETNLADELQSLKCEITASGGNGSPDSPIPIVGHSELNIDIGIDNFLNETTFSQGSIDAATGEELASPYRVRTDFIWLEEGNYLISSPNGFDIVADIYDENKSFKIGESYTSWVSTPRKISILSGGRYARVLFRKTNNSSITPSEISGELLTKIINTDTVAFGQTVYGGVYDANSSKVTDNVKKFTYTDIINNFSSYDGTLNRYRADMKTINNSIDGGDGSIVNPSKAICNIADCSLSWNQMAQNVAYPNKVGVYKNEAWNYTRVYIYIDDNSITTREQAETWLTNHNFELAYEIATPIVIGVPSISVFAENGTNNVFSDTGDTEVKYLYKA